MFSNKKFNFITKNKKRLKNILYLILFIFFSFTTYLNIPKLLNFSVDSVKKNLKNNNNININNITKINYKIFPTPRLHIPNSNFTIGENNIEINNSELEIILNLTKILDYKEVSYKKLLINKGYSKIDLDNISKLLSNINKIKKKTTFKENNLIFFKNDFLFFEINKAKIKINQSGNTKQLNINGNFLNNEIFIQLKNEPNNKNNFILEIPKLNIASNLFSEKKDFDNFSGFFNFKIFNNLLKFNYIKKNNLKLINGFSRSKLIKSSFEGEITLKPNFFLKLDFKISNLNIKKLFPLIQKTFFVDNKSNLILIKKINGVFNFNSKFDGKITNQNGKILFEDFKIGKNKSFFLNAKIDEFGQKGKIFFNLTKVIKHKKNILKKILISGFIIPHNSKIIFEKLSIDENEVSVKKVKEYQKKLEDELVQDSLENIFNENKINEYLKSLF